MVRPFVPFRLSGGTRNRLAALAYAVGDVIEAVVNDMDGVETDPVEARPVRQANPRAPYRSATPADEVTKRKAKQLLSRQGLIQLERKP